jgi:ketosteroid isomerase-like protein
MKRRQLSILSNGAIFFAVAVTSRIFAQDPAPAAEDVAAPREMAKRDRDFSALSVEKGMPAAFLAYFADAGIAFAPRAVNGKKFWGGVKEFAGTLVWAPIFAASSRAGDLGYTTGPWELKKENQAGSFGNYVTVWQKQAGGEWKVALDVGVDNPQPTEPPPALQIIPANVAASGREEARRKYRRTQLAFADHARQDIGKALLEYAAGEVRVLRDKSFPAVGNSAAQILLGSDHGKVARESGGTRLSNSADLAYSYGNYSEERGNVNERGIYVTIWQIDLNGDWKIVLDLQKTIPSAKP